MLTAVEDGRAEMYMDKSPWRGRGMVGTGLTLLLTCPRISRAYVSQADF